MLRSDLDVTRVSWIRDYKLAISKRTLDRVKNRAGLLDPFGKIKVELPSASKANRVKNDSYDIERMVLPAPLKNLIRALKQCVH